MTETTRTELVSRDWQLSSKTDMRVRFAALLVVAFPVRLASFPKGPMSAMTPRSV
jgi:hypothetical protein